MTLVTEHAALDQNLRYVAPRVCARSMTTCGGSYQLGSDSSNLPRSLLSAAENQRLIMIPT